MNDRPIKYALHSALDTYLYAMRPFIVRCLSQVDDNGLEDTIRCRLNGGQVAQFDRDMQQGKTVQDCIDIGHLVFLVSRTWNEVFRHEFNDDRAVHNRMGEIKHLRNRLAHPSQQDIEQDIDPETGKKGLASIADVLGRINRHDEKEQVETVAEQLFGVVRQNGGKVRSSAWPGSEEPDHSAPIPTEASVLYWVYEDDPTNRARIHKASCRFCNNGLGLHGSRLPDNRWLGPFESIDVALETALETNRADTAECGHCRPLQ